MNDLLLLLLILHDWILVSATYALRVLLVNPDGLRVASEVLLVGLALVSYNLLLQLKHIA